MWHIQVKKIRTFLDDKKNPETLPDEDRFVFEVHKFENNNVVCGCMCACVRTCMCVHVCMSVCVAF